MGLPHLSGFLVLAAAFNAFLGVCAKLGVAPTRGFRLMRRRDNPDAFDATLVIMAVMLNGILLIGPFGEWADAHAGP